MASKLKDLEVTKVDFVKEGANPDAHIKLFKKKENKPSVLEAIKKIFKKNGIEDDTSDALVEEIKKSGAITFGEVSRARDIERIADEIWSVCYSLQASLCSIVRDEEVTGNDMSTLMNESVSEFKEFIDEAIKSWSTGSPAKIAKAKCSLEDKKATIDRLKKEVEEEESPDDEEDETALVGKSIDGLTTTKGEEEMKIDKSKLSAGERAFLEEIEKKYSVEEQPKPDTTAEAVAKALKSLGLGEKEEPTEDVQKGINAEEKAELEALRKFKREKEESELKEIAKKYTAIGKTEDELLPVLKNLKAVGEDALANMLSILDQAVTAVDNSGIFTEIGKSRGANDGATSDPIAKARAKAIEIRKSRPELSERQALDEAIMSDPELLAELDK